VKCVLKGSKTHERLFIFFKEVKLILKIIKEFSQLMSRFKSHPIIIMFDFDGVIIDSRGSCLAAIELMKNPSYKWNEEILKKTKSMDIIRRFEMSDSMSSKQGFRNILKNFKDLLPNSTKRAKFFMNMGLRFRKYEYNANEFLPGIIQTLKLLNDSGIIMGICTNSEGNRLPYWLKKKNCEQYISACTSRDDKHIYGIKPDPRPLLNLLLRIKKKHHLGRIDKSQVYFCGDNATDIWSAQNAGLKSVAVLSGHARQEELGYIGADYVFESINDLKRIPQIQQEILIHSAK
jgi:phosphoglycolate phosphatase-like HAD superfamily hydrolase